MNRAVIIESETPEIRQLWESLYKVATALGPDSNWCLVGGLMVHLLCIEHQEISRPTTDIDLLGDARSRPSQTSQISRTLTDLGATLKQPSRTTPDTGYVFTWEDQTIEVLGPDGLRADPETVTGYKTIQVKGGTQALRRAEVVSVSISGVGTVDIRRPSLLGATLR